MLINEQFKFLTLNFFSVLIHNFLSYSCSRLLTLPYPFLSNYSYIILDIYFIIFQPYYITPARPAPPTSQFLAGPSPSFQLTF